MRFDELHKLLSDVYLDALAEGKPREDVEKDVEDWFFEMMVDAYLAGFYDVNLGLHPEPDLDHMDEVITMKYGEDEKTVAERIVTHIRESSLAMLITLADSEYHRMTETGSYDAAVSTQHLLDRGLRPSDTGKAPNTARGSGKKDRPVMAKPGSKKATVYKTWKDVGDLRVRDTHQYLNGISVPLNDYFFSISGDYGRFPGDFKTAEENANCRCSLKYSIVYSDDETAGKSSNKTRNSQGRL